MRLTLHNKILYNCKFFANLSMKTLLFNKHKMVYIAPSNQRKKISEYILTSLHSIINLKHSKVNLKWKTIIIIIIIIIISSSSSKAGWQHWFSCLPLTIHPKCLSLLVRPLDNTECLCRADEWIFSWSPNTGVFMRMHPKKNITHEFIFSFSSSAQLGQFARWEVNGHTIAVL